MKKLALTFAALVLLPGLVAAQECNSDKHRADTAQMSCADGTMLNTDTNNCEPITTG